MVIINCAEMFRGYPILVKPGDLASGKLRAGAGREILRRKNARRLLHPLLEQFGVELESLVARRIRADDLLKLREVNSGEFLSDLGRQRLAGGDRSAVTLKEIIEDCGVTIPGAGVELSAESSRAWHFMEQMLLKLEKKELDLNEKLAEILNARDRCALFFGWDDAVKLSEAGRIQEGSPDFYQKVVLPYFRGEVTMSERRAEMIKLFKLLGISDGRVLQVMGEIPREKFVPDKIKDKAYNDTPLPIGRGQTISQPSLIAFMTQCLFLTSSATVLEVGAGSGYQAAILGKLCRQVYAVERIPRFINKARKALAELGINNVAVIKGDGSLGLPRFAPFDRIIVSAQSEDIPGELLEQLADGGTMLIPIGPPEMQKLTLIIKRGGRIIRQEISDCQFVPLIRSGAA